MECIKCNVCKGLVPECEFYADWYYCSYCKDTHDIQPERSKREDSCHNCFELEKACGNCFSQDGICPKCGRLVRCGALNTVVIQ